MPFLTRRDQNGVGSPGGGSALPSPPWVARYASRLRRSSSSSSRSVNLRSRGTASRYTLIESSLLVWPAPHFIHQWPPSRLGIAASTLNVRFCNTTVSFRRRCVAPTESNGDATRKSAQRHEPASEFRPETGQTSEIRPKPGQRRSRAARYQEIGQGIGEPSPSASGSW